MLAGPPHPCDPKADLLARPLDAEAVLVGTGSQLRGPEAGVSRTPTSPLGDPHTSTGPHRGGVDKRRDGIARPLPNLSMHPWEMK